MKALRNLVRLSVLVITLVGCSKSMDDYPLSNLRAISSFTLEFYHNAEANIFVQHVGTIDEANKVIHLSVPVDADLCHLCPTIQLSPWATITPRSLEIVDFSRGDSLDYMVSAQSGKQAVYTVHITRDYIYDKAELLAVYAMDLLDDHQEPRRCTYASFAEGAQSKLWVPVDTDLSHVRIYLDLSNASRRSTIEVCESGDKTSFREFANNTEMDFRNGFVFIRITSESGKAITYQLYVELILAA